MSNKQSELAHPTVRSERLIGGSHISLSTAPPKVVTILRTSQQAKKSHPRATFVEPSQAQWPDTVPTVWNIPITTLIASGISVTLFIITIIIICSSDCNGTAARYILPFACQAVLASICMVLSNIYWYKRYRFDCLSLSISLLFSSSIGFSFLGCVMATYEGLCGSEPIFMSGSALDLSIWLITLIGACFMTVAHYYYG